MTNLRIEIHHFKNIAFACNKMKLAIADLESKAMHHKKITREDLFNLDNELEIIRNELLTYVEIINERKTNRKTH